MDTLEFIEKPDWVTWEEIQACQRLAHEQNFSRGIHMLCSDISGEELASSIGDGWCYVALDGKNVAGTCSVKYIITNKWWHKGKCAYICYGAVKPDYKGMGIYTRLQELIMTRLHNDKISFVWLNTHENNIPIQTLYFKDGYQLLQYSTTSEGADYYSVILGKWLEKCPYSKFRIKMMFLVSKIVVRLLWKPGRIPRFCINRKK